MREKRLGHGISIQGFDSLEEILEHQAAQEQAAIAATLPEQWEISYGDSAFRLAEDLPIFGQVFSQRDFLDRNLGGDEAFDREIRQEWVGIEDAHARGYRYGRWYSQVVPDGEYGSAHVVTLWKISQADFERARFVNWQVWAELALKLSNEIMQARAKQGDIKRGE